MKQVFFLVRSFRSGLLASSPVADARAIIKLWGLCFCSFLVAVDVDVRAEVGVEVFARDASVGLGQGESACERKERLRRKMMIILQR